MSSRIEEIDQLPTKSIPHHKMRKFWYFVILGAVIIPSILSISYYKPRLSIAPSPKNAVALINGQPISANQQFSPGIYQLTVSSPGYIRYSQTLTLKAFTGYEQKVELKPVPEPKQVVSGNVFALSGNIANNKFYYLGNQGKTIFELALHSQGDNKLSYDQRPVTPDTLPQISKVIFSPDFGQAIFKLSSGETGLYDFKRYDLVHQEYSSWGGQIGEIAWRPDGQKLLYYYEGANGEHSLIQTTRQHDTIERIFDLNGEGITNPKLEWSTDGNLVMLVAKNNLYLLDYPTKTLTKLVEGDIDSARFAPTANQIIFTQAGHLKLIGFNRINPLTQDPKEAELIGKIKPLAILDLGIDASAEKAAFSSVRNLSVVADNANNLYQIELTPNSEKAVVTKLELKTAMPSLINDLSLSTDGKQLFYLNDLKQLMVVPLETSNYKK